MSDFKNEMEEYIMENLTRENFRNVSENSFREIKKYLERFERLIEKPLDYHFEETEEALFNWIHRDTNETPFEIKNALMPRSLVNVLHIKEGWFFWYV